MDYKEFIQKYHKELAANTVPGSRVNLENVLRRAFGEGPAPDDKGRYEPFYQKNRIKMIFETPSGKVARRQFSYDKFAVTLFYGWLLDLGYVTEDIVEYVNGLSYYDVMTEKEMQRYYFVSLDSMLDYICGVGKAYGFRSDNDLLQIKSIAILAWYGLSAEEMTLFKKSDILRSEYAIRVNGKKIQIERRAYEYLISFASIDIHETFMQHTTSTLVPSEYLLRTRRAAQASSQSVTSALKRFNSVAVERGQVLDICSLHSNKRMIEIYEVELQTNQTPTSIAYQLYNIDRSEAFTIATKYKFWKRWLYNTLDKGGQ